MVETSCSRWLAMVVQQKSSALYSLVYGLLLGEAWSL